MLSALLAKCSMQIGTYCILIHNWDTAVLTPKVLVKLSKIVSLKISFVLGPFLDFVK